MRKPTSPVSAPIIMAFQGVTRVDYPEFFVASGLVFATVGQNSPFLSRSDVELAAPRPPANSDRLEFGDLVIDPNADANTLAARSPT